MISCANMSRKRSRDTSEATGLHVAIIGGGLSGLACALALQMKNTGVIKDIKVYERDVNFDERRQGFGLTLTNNPKGPLAELGVLSECIAKNCPSTCHYVFTPAGQILGYYGRAFKPDTMQEYDSTRVGNLRIPRQDLRRMLLDRLHPGTVQWGYKLIEYTENSTGGVELDFGREHTIHADILIGADGFRSTLRQLRDAKLQRTPGPIVAPSFMGITVILGLSHLSHPLIDNRGFYVLDGEHRLFVMPFRHPTTTVGPLTMWQLSFSGLSEDAALRLKQTSPEGLLAYAQDRTSAWFPMVHAMITATDLSEIWCTALYDRHAMNPRKKEDLSRVVVLGDACHPMSMFKGQGANQAIGDGPLLASWLLRPGLTRENLHTRLKCFENEMIAKSTPKVNASREAAQHLHSAECLEEDIGIEGVPREQTRDVLLSLCRQKVDANCAQDLDARVLEVIGKWTARGGTFADGHEE